jgi:Prolyl oligopeptidase family/Dipeptidyl peptidase IV (DPP IV) N-terminal region
MHRVDICVADTATGEVKTLIEERLNTYIEIKPLWLVNNGQELIHWSERDGWGHYYLFDGGGALKNQITSGEFYCDSIEKNSELAKNLKGRLLLVTGDMDDNVHPANTLRMADALIKANKRFDFFIIPGKRHGFADAANYFFWIRADYFCRRLLGDAAESVDLIELNKEREQSGERGRGR